MGYRLTGQAEEDVIDIAQDGIVGFGAAQSRRYHDSLKMTFERLAAHPEMAPIRAELAAGLRAHPHGTHVIVYRIDASGDVEILRVVHGREDWQQGGW